MVRSRKGPLNFEILCETLAKIIESLHVAVRPVYTPVTMAEVNIRHDKYSAVIQNLLHFGEFLGLEGPHIFKKTLGNDDVERLSSNRIGVLMRSASIGFGAGLCMPISIP